MDTFDFARSTVRSWRIRRRFIGPRANGVALLKEIALLLRATPELVA